MNVLSTGRSWVDLEFQGRPDAIATAVISSAGSVALVDPGPATCLEALERGLERQGIRLADVTDLLLTHIHLDHAGATGSMVRRYPGLRVVVHERGAPHLADPTKLLASATRLWGDAMGRLWGEVAPVPVGNLVVVSGGERITAAGVPLDVAYTPGHASHHVSFFDRASGVAYVGDTAGVSVRGGYILPPTPPPDIDLGAWEASVARIEAWSPETLFLTHFGPVHAVRPHLRTLMANLTKAAAFVEATLREGVTDEEGARRFTAFMERELRQALSEAQLAVYLAGAPLAVQWSGLARYVRKAGHARTS